MPHQTSPVETADNPLDKKPTGGTRWLAAFLGLLLLAAIIAMVMGVL